MNVRGIRGATTVGDDDPELVLEATQELLEAIVNANSDFYTQDIVSIIFTVTEDLISIHPAQAARRMGWDTVPMLCAQEIPVPGTLTKCIRVLIHWNTEMDQKSIKHVYLNNAVVLRPDLVTE